MRLLSILLFCFLTTHLYSQQYNTLHFERKDTYANNKIYTPGKIYTFNYSIINDDAIIIVNDSLRQEFKLDDCNNSKGSIKLAVLQSARKNRTNKRQTEIVYHYKELKQYTGTGLVENQMNLWLHPPRQHYFKALELCPFPYLKHTINKGDSWTDQMKIGPQWSNPLWGEWEKSLLLNYTYTYSNDTTLSTTLGNIECKVIHSKSNSRIGVYYLTSYFSNTYGAVRMHYKLHNGTIIELNLVNLEFKPPYQSLHEYVDSEILPKVNKDV